MNSTEIPSSAPSAIRWAAWMLVAALWMPTVAASADEATGRSASEHYTVRTVGGKEAESGAWPWQVALMHPGEGGSLQFCGGSVIHPRWVLTAAHCAEPFTADEIEVLAGTRDLDEGGRRIGVKAIWLHPGYVDPANSGNDIALLELDRPAGVEKAVALPDARRAAAVAKPGVPATVIGWGLLRPLQCVSGGEEGTFPCRLRGGGIGHYVDDLTGKPVKESHVTTSRLMQVVLPLVGEEACLDAYPGAAIDDRTLCAGLSTGGKDSCQGDSGGPLVVRDGDEWVQVGVVSWGASCAKPGQYGVYARTGAFAEWVNRTTGLVLATSGAVAVTETAASQPLGDRAFLIGINRYQDDAISDLQGAVNDVRNMRDMLAAYLGFDAEQIRLLTDEQATRAGILNGIRDWLVAGTRPGSRALLYYAGHGYRQPDRDGDEPDGHDEALVPHDARLESSASGGLDRYANLILDDEIAALFDDLEDRQAYMIVDSCFSGTITRSLGAPDPRAVRTLRPRYSTKPRSARPSEPDPGFIEREGNLVAWTAVASNQVALEDLEAEPPQGFFTGRFVRGIAERRADRDRDGRIVHSELLDYVRSESEAYCARQQQRCPSGLTPQLEGPRGLLARDLVVVGPPTVPDTAEVADAALGHDNAADVRVEMLPSQRVRLGEKIKLRVRSRQSGHLLLVDVAADGTVTQIFPNRWSERAGAGTMIEAGRTVEIPNHYYGFSLPASEPTGPGILFAVVTENSVSLDDLAPPDQAFEPVPDAPRWLLAIGDRLREPLMSEDGAWTRTRRWSHARLDYEIVR